MNTLNILYNCSFGDKIIILFVKLIIILITFFLVIGVFAPKNYIIWHCLLCLLLLFYIDFNDNNCYDYISNDIIKKYSKDITITTIPFETYTIKILLISLMLISIFNYLYPKYSGYNLLNNIINYFNNDHSYNDNNIEIITEFKSKKKTSNLEKKIKLINEDTIDLNNLGSVLDVFDTKIEPVKIEILNNNVNLSKIEPIKSQPINKIKESLNKFNSNFI